MNQRTRGKGISVRKRLDTSAPSPTKGGCRWTILVNLRGKKKLYEVEPPLYMDSKYWVPKTDPATGRKMKEKTILHAKGNPNSRQMERELAAAEGRILEAIDELLDSGRNISHAALAAKLRIGGKETLAMGCKAYMDSRVHLWGEGREGGTFKRNRWLTNLVEGYDSTTLLTSVDTEWIGAFQKWMLEDAPNALKKGKSGFKPSTVNGVLYFLGEVINEAHAEGKIERNPYKRFISSRRKVSNRIPEAQTLTSEEIDRLQEAWDRKEFLMAENPKTLPSAEAMRLHESLQQVLICAYTGFRYSELKKLQNPALFRIAESHISLVTKKTKAVRSVKITRRLDSVLERQEGGHVLIGQVPLDGTLNRRFRKILDRLGMPNPEMKLHCLRKTFVTILYERTGDLNAVSMAVGHTNAGTTKRHYLATNTKHIDWVVDRLDTPDTKPKHSSEDILDQVWALRAANPNIILPPKLLGWLEEYQDSISR